MKKVVVLLCATVMALFIFSCKSQPPIEVDTNTDDGDVVSDEPVGDDADANKPTTCAWDGECDRTGDVKYICVKGTCTIGCKDDGECAGTAGTKCNKKLGRCVNVEGVSGACSEDKCGDKSSCCRTTKGLQSLTCDTSPTVSKCGACKQGEIYNGNDCIMAACTKLTECNTLNKNETYPKCWECDTQGAKEKKGLCVDVQSSQPQCTGSKAILINSIQCIPAGERCVVGEATCCSGQPCIQGYCY